MTLAKFEKGILNLVGIRIMGRVKAWETQSGAMTVIWVRGLGPGGSDKRGRSERIFLRKSRWYLKMAGYGMQEKEKCEG